MSEVYGDEPLKYLEKQKADEALKRFKSGELMSVEEITKPYRDRIAELELRLNSAEFWQGVYPEGWTAEKVENEMHDYNMLLDGMDSLYMHVTGGKASKPNTSKAVIKSLHDDHLNEIVEQETLGLDTKVEQLRYDLAVANTAVAQTQLLLHKQAETISRGVALVQKIDEVLRTTRLMVTEDGHEVICIQPHLWAEIITLKGAMK